MRGVWLRLDEQMVSGHAGSELTWLVLTNKVSKREKSHGMCLEVEIGVMHALQAMLHRASFAATTRVYIFSTVLVGTRSTEARRGPRKNSRPIQFLTGADSR